MICLPCTIELPLCYRSSQQVPVTKKMKDLSADILILACKIIFQNMASQNIVSNVGGNTISDKFEKFCQNLNIEQAVSSSKQHQCNGQEEACIKSIKCTIKKCTDTKSDIHIALLQIRSTPLGPKLPSLAKPLFNHPITDMMPIINRLLVN